MSARHEAWFDDEAGPLVRSYAVTGGRTRSDTLGLDLITLVVALRTAHEAGMLEPEYARIIALCQRPVSVAEVAARVDLPPRPSRYSRNARTRASSSSSLACCARCA